MALVSPQCVWQLGSNVLNPKLQLVHFQAKYLRAVPKLTPQSKGTLKTTLLKDDKEDRRMPKPANLVDMMMEFNLQDSESEVRTHDAGVETDPPRTVSAEFGPPAVTENNENKTSSKLCVILWLTNSLKKLLVIDWRIPWRNWNALRHSIYSLYHSPSVVNKCDFQSGVLLFCRTTFQRCTFLATHERGALKKAKQVSGRLPGCLYSDFCRQRKHKSPSQKVVSFLLFICTSLASQLGFSWNDKNLDCLHSLLLFVRSCVHVHAQSMVLFWHESLFSFWYSCLQNCTTQCTSKLKRVFSVAQTSWKIHTFLSDKYKKLSLVADTQLKKLTVQIFLLVKYKKALTCCGYSVVKFTVQDKRLIKTTSDTWNQNRTVRLDRQREAAFSTRNLNVNSTSVWISKIYFQRELNPRWKKSTKSLVVKVLAGHKKVQTMSNQFGHPWRTTGVWKRTQAWHIPMPRVDFHDGMRVAVNPPWRSNKKQIGKSKSPQVVRIYSRLLASWKHKNVVVRTCMHALTHTHAPARACVQHRKPRAFWNYSYNAIMKMALRWMHAGVNWPQSSFPKPYGSPAASIQASDASVFCTFLTLPGGDLKNLPGVLMGVCLIVGAVFTDGTTLPTATAFWKHCNVEEIVCVCTHFLLPESYMSMDTKFIFSSFAMESCRNHTSKHAKR